MIAKDRYARLLMNFVKRYGLLFDRPVDINRVIYRLYPEGVNPSEVIESHRKGSLPLLLKHYQPEQTDTLEVPLTDGSTLIFSGIQVLDISDGINEQPFDGSFKLTMVDKEGI